MLTDDKKDSVISCCNVICPQKSIFVEPLQNNIYLNFMRTNPPFDPRIQPVGIYANNPIPQGPQMYMQPMMHQPGNPPVNYMQMPIISQTHPAPSYPVIGQHQIQQQYVGEAVRMQRQQVQGQAGQIVGLQQPKPMSVIGNQSSNESQKNKVQQQNKQNTSSHNGQQQEQYEEGYEGQQQQQMKNQQIIMFWQHKFYTILQRFQLIFQKVQWIRSQFYNLNNQLKAVDSEEEWNQAKQHHEDFMEQLQQFSQELAGVINENANLLQQQDSQGNEHNVWRQRYFQLFEGYKAMEQQLFELKQSGSKPTDPNLKVSEIMSNYRQLEREYSQVVNQLNQMKQITNKSHENNNEKAYREKLDFAIKEAEKYKQTLDQLHKENEELLSAMEELKSEKNHYESIALESNSQKNTNIQLHEYEQFHRALNDRDEQIAMLTKQLKELSQKYNYLVQTYNSMELRLREEQTTGKNRIREMQQQLNSKNNQLMEIKIKVHDSELKLKSGSSISEQYQKMLKIRTSELQDRTNQILKLRNQLNAAQNYRRPEPERQIGIPRKDHELKMRKIQEQYEQKLDILKKKLKKKEQESQNTALLNIKLESLEKKNKMLIAEIQNLNKDLYSKQKQFIELKRNSNNQQKFKELEYRFNRLAEEKEQIYGSLMQKNHDYDNLQSTVNQFQERIKSLSENSHVHSAKPLIGQIEELNKIIQIKEGEINKLKASVALKQSNIRELQNQVEKTKSSIITNQKLHSRQKDALQESVRASQRRNQQNEKKMRDLQYEFGSIMKKNLEEEIKNLRVQNQQRQQTIIRLEAQELELRSRLSHFERIRSAHNGDVDELTNRIKQLQTSKYDMIKKVETSFRDVKNKQRQNRELTDTVRNLQENIFRLENQMKENQKLIKQKDKIIDNLQGQLLVTNQRFSYLNSEHENLRTRSREQSNYLSKETDDLRRKVFQIEHLNGSRKELKDKFSAQITKIQNQTIQQLREEKQFLKIQLANALQHLGHLPNFGSSDRKGTSSKKSKASQGIDYIQKRLFDFNTKLDEIIVKNKQISTRGFGSNIQNGGSSSRVNNQHEEQIKILKNQIQQLRKYISKLEVEAGNQTIKYNPKNSIIYMQQEKAYNQRMEFYQRQTNQLQNRIQNLIKVNSSLKERVDSLLRDSSNVNSNNFYKNQLSLSQETIDNLQGKVTRLLQQNRNLKLNTNQTTSKTCRDYEDKIFECENKIFGLERKISSLELERNRIQNERVGLQRNLNTTQSELSSTKSTTQKQLKIYQTNNRELTDQVQNLQGSLAQLLEKVRILQSENSRLTQAVNSSYSQQHIFLNTPVRDSSNKASTFKR